VFGKWKADARNFVCGGYGRSSIHVMNLDQDKLRKFRCSMKKKDRLRNKITCPSCFSGDVILIGKTPSTDIFAGKNLLESLDGGSLYSCCICKCSFRFPRMSKSIMDAMYLEGDENNWSLGTGEERADWNIAYEWLQRREANYQVLDVGCFSGGFLNGLNHNADIYGIELNEQAADKAKKMGVNIIGGDYERLGSLAQTFDVVTSFDVIEHTYSPASFLGSLAHVTKPNGEIIIATGNTMAPSWKLMGSRYWYCAIGEHLSFINPDWCQHVANKCGLELVEIQKFSHAKQKNLSIVNKLKEAALNLIYRFLPFALRFARKHGMGGKDIKKHPELANFPPTWMTAQDHFIVKFRKLK
jgi:SAM-dependent methyltransferase